MKSFKEYLTESKKVYEFKVKIAGPCPKDITTHIKAALSKYNVEKCSSGKSTPIQERYEEFPNLQNVELTIFEVSTTYPVNSLQVRNAVAETASVPLSNIIVRNSAEEAEHALNHANDEKSGEALLGQDYENSNNQDAVGTKQAFGLLKDLNKVKHQGEQYTGVNDALLAKTSPTEKQPKVSDKINNTGPLAKVDNPDPRKGL